MYSLTIENFMQIDVNNLATQLAALINGQLPVFSFSHALSICFFELIEVLLFCVLCIPSSLGMLG
jgi:hypothetical protein